MIMMIMKMVLDLKQQSNSKRIDRGFMRLQSQALSGLHVVLMSLRG